LIEEIKVMKESRKAANEKWDTKKSGRINLKTRKEWVEQVKNHAQKRRLSITQFIMEAVDDKMMRDIQDGIVINSEEKSPPD